MTSLKSISANFDHAIDAYRKVNKTVHGYSKGQSINEATGLGVLHNGDKIDIIEQGGVKERSFPHMVQEIISEDIQKIKKSEKLNISAIKGTVNTIEVMQALNESEVALQKIVTIRDKIVSAYLDILKMPL